MDAPGKLLKDDSDVVASSGSPPGRLKATDCRRIARYEGHPGHWISSPNLEFIPELPEPNSSEPLVYFADGMLGRNEHLKWPQKYYADLPHAMAAPGNPGLILSQTNEIFTPDAQDFSVQDVQGVLPAFADLGAPWFNFSQKDFVVTDEIPSAEVGGLSQKIVLRLKEAMEDTLRIWRSIAEKLADEVVGTRESSRTEGLFDYFVSVASRLSYTVKLLARGALSTFHTLLWFREYQRLLLDLRAVIIYVDVIKPRLDDPSCDFSQLPLPLRGVITNKEVFVAELYRVGVPVWFVRRTETMTTRTFIGRVCRPVPAGVSFSSRRAMRHGKHSQTAPAWSQAPNDDPTNGNIIHRLQKFSLTNHAIVSEVTAYNHDRVRELEQAKDEDVVMAGPDLDISAMETVDVSVVEEGSSMTAIDSSEFVFGGIDLIFC